MRKDWLSRAVMNVTPRHASVRLKFRNVRYTRPVVESERLREEGRINRLQGDDTGDVCLSVYLFTRWIGFVRNDTC